MSMLVCTVRESKEAASESWLLPGSQLHPRKVFSQRIEFWAGEGRVCASYPLREACLLP